MTFLLLLLKFTGLTPLLNGGPEWMARARLLGVASVLGHVLQDVPMRESARRRWKLKRADRSKTHLVQQLLQNLLLSDLHLTAGDGGVVDTQDPVDIVHALGPRVSQLLDLGGSVLDLLVGHLQLQLFGTALNGAVMRRCRSEGDQHGEESCDHRLAVTHFHPVNR